MEINNNDCNFKVNNKLKNLLFDVEEMQDSLVDNWSFYLYNQPNLNIKKQIWFIQNYITFLDS